MLSSFGSNLHFLKDGQTNKKDKYFSEIITLPILSFKVTTNAVFLRKVHMNVIVMKNTNKHVLCKNSQHLRCFVSQQKCLMHILKSQ